MTPQSKIIGHAVVSTEGGREVVTGQGTCDWAGDMWVGRSLSKRRAEAGREVGTRKS